MSSTASAALLSPNFGIGNAAELYISGTSYPMGCVRKSYVRNLHRRRFGRAVWPAFSSCSLRHTYCMSSTASAALLSPNFGIGNAAELYTSGTSHPVGGVRKSCIRNLHRRRFGRAVWSPKPVSLCDAGFATPEVALGCGFSSARVCGFVRIFD